MLILEEFQCMSQVIALRSRSKKFIDVRIPSFKIKQWLSRSLKTKSLANIDKIHWGNRLRKCCYRLLSIQREYRFNLCLIIKDTESESKTICLNNARIKTIPKRYQLTRRVVIFQYAKVWCELLMNHCVSSKNISELKNENSRSKQQNRENR